MPKGYIRMNPHTVGHAAWLRSAGYSVEESADRILIECTRMVSISGVLDWSKGIAEGAAALVAEKLLISYHQPVLLPSGKILSGKFLCAHLEALTGGWKNHHRQRPDALVANESIQPIVPKATMADIVALARGLAKA